MGPKESSIAALHAFPRCQLGFQPIFTHKKSRIRYQDLVPQLPGKFKVSFLGLRALRAFRARKFTRRARKSPRWAPNYLLIIY